MNMSGNSITTRDCSRFDKVRFINLVRKHEALYNRQHPHYSDKDYVDPILERIAAEVGLNGCESARNKWKSLKVCYKFHKLNIANPTAKQKKNPLKKWPYFELMKFLDPHTVTRKKEFANLSAVIPEPASVSNCSYPSDASSSHPANDPFADSQLNPDQYYVKQEPIFQDALMQMEDDHHNHTGGGSSDNDWTEAINGRLGTAIAVDQAAEIVTAVRESARGVEAAIASASRLDQDENAQYGRFIASRLRKLTSRQKHKIRKGIEDVFYEIELESHQESASEILPN